MYVLLKLLMVTVEFVWSGGCGGGWGSKVVCKVILLLINYYLMFYLTPAAANDGLAAVDVGGAEGGAVAAVGAEEVLCAVLSPMVESFLWQKSETMYQSLIEY